MVWNRRLDLLERFWKKVEKTDSCWNWTAYTIRGYGQFRYDGKGVYAHRFSYELLKGKIPDGLTLDHLCRNRKCVNPDHLEPVTNKENILRGEGITAKSARQTHCKNGHEFTLENTIRRKDQPNNRICKICNSERSKKYKKRLYLEHDLP